jgi:hypothetical protein
MLSEQKRAAGDVIDDVFSAIERHPDWLKEYQGLCGDLGRTVVNTWGGFWVASSVGRSRVKQVSSEKSKLIDSYSKLSATKTKAGKKVKEPEALQAMATYYQVTSPSCLPACATTGADRRASRAGLAPGYAFSAVLAKQLTR